jgi:hypothetical protein
LLKLSTAAHPVTSPLTELPLGGIVTGAAAPKVPVAVFVYGPHVEGAVATIVTVADAPAAIVPRLHVTAGFPHDPVLGVAETSTKPAGSGSETITFVASAVPAALLTVTVQLMFPPMVTSAGPPPLTTFEITGAGVPGPGQPTTVPLCEAGEPGMACPVPKVPDALLVNGPHVEGAVATIVTVADAPAAIVPRLHVTAGFPHDPVLGVAETSTKPAGSGSETITFVALDPPVFATVMVQVMFVLKVTFVLGLVFVMVRAGGVARPWTPRFTVSLPPTPIWFAWI